MLLLDELGDEVRPMKSCRHHEDFHPLLTPSPNPRRDGRSRARRRMAWISHILKTEVRDQILAAHMAQGVLELHELNEDVVFGYRPGAVMGP